VLKRMSVLAGWLFAGSLFAAGCAGGSATPSPTQEGPSPTPVGSPTPVPAPTATVTFDGMMLDPAGGADSRSRTFSFVSDGAGVVSASVKSQDPGDMTLLCVSTGPNSPNCKATNSPSLAIQAVGEHQTWRVEVISADLATPIVSVSLSWPTQSAVLTLTHGRLQGSSSPNVPEELNGFSVSFAPRGAGFVTLQASWTVIVTDIDIGLADATTQPETNLEEKQFQRVTKIDPPYTYGVVAGKLYRLTLRNLDADNYRPDLIAVITFP
jgi:hypothetical protein